MFAAFNILQELGKTFVKRSENKIGDGKYCRL